MKPEGLPDLTTTEEGNLQNLKERMKNTTFPEHLNETFTCYRFLKAQNFHVVEAETALRKNLKWREDNRIDFIESEYDPPEVYKKYFCNNLPGYDKLGSPYLYIPLGKYDVRGLHLAGKYSVIEKSFLALVLEGMEKIVEERSKKMNKLLRCIFIYDFEGVTFANATNKKGVETGIKIMKLLQDNYPERVKTLYAINASAYFTVFFSLVKNFISPGIMNKIQILGTSDYQEELLKFIDADELPTFLGGTKTDPDGNPLCLTMVNLGGKVEEKYFIHKSTRSLSDHPDVKTLVLSRASFSEIFLEVPEAGCYIEYEFETRTRDIGFGLFRSERVEGEEKISELVPLQRMETEDFTETGMYKCDKAGKYIMLFDNSYSWVRAKEIYYLVRVKTPREVEQFLTHGEHSAE